jgi:hypothetical protein
LSFESSEVRRSAGLGFWALGRLNGVVREVAGGYDAGVAELSDVFGHRVIAGAFVEALGLEEGRG